MTGVKIASINNESLRNVAQNSDRNGNAVLDPTELSLFIGNAFKAYGTSAGEFNPSELGVIYSQVRGATDDVKTYVQKFSQLEKLHVKIDSLRNQHRTLREKGMS